jgi:hypothetical protein
MSKGFYVKCYGCDSPWFQFLSVTGGITESYGCGIGIVGGCGWGIEDGGADRVVRNGSKDGLAASVAFRSIACPFLYTVKVMLFQAILFWPKLNRYIYDIDTTF